MAPYYSYTTPIPESLEVWEWYGKRTWGPGVPRAWGSLEKSKQLSGDSPKASMNMILLMCLYLVR